MLALNVTIYGLGIVFLALLVLMFAIMILTKAFSAVTGNELFPVPTATSSPVATAMSARADGSGSLPAPETPPSSRPVAGDTLVSALPVTATPAAASAFKMEIEGIQHQIEVSAGPSGTTTVVVDGASFEIQRDTSDAKRFFVGGKPHTVEVKKTIGGGIAVVVDGVEQKVDLHDLFTAAVTAAVVPAFSAGTFRMLVGSEQHQVEFKDVTDRGATVVVDGASFLVERENARTVLVNGKPHTVEVRERNAASAGVLVDGSPQTVQMIGSAAVVSEKAPVASAPSVPAPAPAAAPAAALAPAPAPAPPSPAPAAAPGEKVIAPLPGKVLSVAVKAGDGVHKGDELCVIEAMKMGNSIKAQRDGIVQEVLVSAGDPVGFGTPLLVIG